VRVAGLIGQAKAGVPRAHPTGAPRRSNWRRSRCAAALLERQQRVWLELRASCARGRLEVAEAAALTEADRGWLDAWFMERVFPVLTPLAVDPAHPFPFIPNMGLVMALQLQRGRTASRMRGLIPLPSQVERFVRLPAGEATAGRSASSLLEDAGRLFLDRVFPASP
jgi:polyphosphate kinase